MILNDKCKMSTRITEACNYKRKSFFALFDLGSKFFNPNTLSHLIKVIPRSCDVIRATKSKIQLQLVIQLWRWILPVFKIIFTDSFEYLCIFIYYEPDQLWSLSRLQKFFTSSYKTFSPYYENIIVKMFFIIKYIGITSITVYILLRNALISASFNI